MENKNKEQSESELITKYIRSLLICSDKFNPITGFLTDPEGMVLYSYARTTLLGDIVEIGSYMGKSTSWLAQALKDADTSRMVYAVDPHTGSPEHQKGEVHSKTFIGNTYDKFMDNIKLNNLDNHVIPIVKKSLDAVKEWNKPIGLLFIDGNHEYDEVRNDFIQWSKFVPVGGTIMLHDTINWPGPKAVVDEFIAQNPKFIFFKINSMTVATRLA